LARVYIPNEGAGHDYSGAEEFGDLVFVTKGLINPFNTGAIVRYWTKALEGSSPDDWIVMTSLNTLCSIGAFLFGQKHGTLNLLIFKKDGKYERRRITYASPTV
jgi:hypothetical protein